MIIPPGLLLVVLNNNNKKELFCACMYAPKCMYNYSMQCTGI